MDSRTGKSTARVGDGEPPGPHEPLRIWAGAGTGLICSLCGRPIGPHEIEYEVELEEQDARGRLRFHVRCQQIWEDQLETPPV